MGRPRKVVESSAAIEPAQAQEPVDGTPPAPIAGLITSNPVREVVDPQDIAAPAPEGSITVASNDPGTIDLGGGKSFQAGFGKQVVTDPEIIKRLLPIIQGGRHKLFLVK